MTMFAPGPPKKCDPTSIDTCPKWEMCYSGECVIKPGRCNLTADCPPKLGQIASCEPNTHTCNYTPTPEPPPPDPGLQCKDDSTCHYWQDCDPETKRCKLRPHYCEKKEDCKGEVLGKQECDFYNHKCTGPGPAPPPPPVPGKCKPWENEVTDKSIGWKACWVSHNKCHGNNSESITGFCDANNYQQYFQPTSVDSPLFYEPLLG